MKLVLFFFFIVSCAFSQSSRQNVAAPFFTIESSPPGAEVYLDRQLLGATPFQSNSILPGKHLLEVFYPSARSWDVQKQTDTIIIQSTLKLQKFFRFTPVITLITGPEGVEVFRNDTLVGITPLRLLFQQRNNDFLTLKKSGYATRVMRSDSLYAQLHQTKLNRSQTAFSPVLFLRQEEIPSSRSFKTYAAYASIISFVASGIAAAHYERRANKEFDLFLQTGNPHWKVSTERNDRRSAFAFTITQISFTSLALLLLTE